MFLDSWQILLIDFWKRILILFKTKSGFLPRDLKYSALFFPFLELCSIGGGEAARSRCNYLWKRQTCEMMEFFFSNSKIFGSKNPKNYIPIFVSFDAMLL